MNDHQHRIRRRRDGGIDTEYYMAKGRDARSLALSQMFRHLCEICTHGKSRTETGEMDHDAASRFYLVSSHQ